MVLLSPAARAGLAALPLAPLAYQELAPRTIRPNEWLRRQLEAIRDYTTGHLDETYPELRDDNNWLGKASDDGEETPYWLDEILPVAHLMHDKALLVTGVQRYVNWSLAYQRLSGYSGALTKGGPGAGQ